MRMAVRSIAETCHVYICFVCASSWCFNKIKKKTCDIGDYHSGVIEGHVTPIRFACSSRRFERSYCPHLTVKQSKRIRWNLKMKKIFFETTGAADPVTRRHIFVSMKICSDGCDWLKCLATAYQCKIMSRSVQCKVLTTVNTTRRQSG